MTEPTVPPKMQCSCGCKRCETGEHCGKTTKGCTVRWDRLPRPPRRGQAIALWTVLLLGFGLVNSGALSAADKKKPEAARAKAEAAVTAATSKDLELFEATKALEMMPGRFVPFSVLRAFLMGDESVKPEDLLKRRVVLSAPKYDDETIVEGAGDYPYTGEEITWRLLAPAQLYWKFREYAPIVFVAPEPFPVRRRYTVIGKITGMMDLKNKYDEVTETAIVVEVTALEGRNASGVELHNKKIADPQYVHKFFK